MVVVVVVAGCGGKRAAEPATAPRSFVAEASRICRTARTDAGRVFRLRRLRPPPDARDVFGHWLKAEEDFLAASDAARGPVDPDGGDPLVPVAIAAGKIAGYARRLGLPGCASGRAVTMPP